MLAGLSKKEILRTPPDFCATAGSHDEIVAKRPTAIITQRRVIAIVLVSRRGGYLSSQTSSMRLPLKMLLTMIVSPLT